MFLCTQSTPSGSWTVTGGETNTDRWPAGSTQKGGLGSLTRFCSWGEAWVGRRT